MAPRAPLHEAASLRQGFFHSVYDFVPSALPDALLLKAASLRTPFWKGLRVFRV